MSELHQSNANGWHGTVPANWPVKRFKYVATVRNGQVDPTDERYVHLPLFAPNHIESGTGRLLGIETADAQGADSGKYEVDAGDVLYSKIRPALRKVAVAPVAGLCSADMYPVKPRPGCHSRYLMYSMLSEGFSQYSLLESDRVAMPKINREALGECPLPLPPLAEQRTIAAFLDRRTATIDALVEKKQRLVERLREKRQALITEAVTRGLDPNAPRRVAGGEWPEEIPAHWSMTCLKRVCDVRTGIAKGRELKGATVVRPYLRVANVQDGYLRLDDVATIEVTEDEANRYRLHRGDVLMNEGGDFDKLGRGYVWEGQIDGCIHQNHVFAVRPRTGVDSFWINLVTQSDPLKLYFMSRSKQSTNLASISATNLGAAPLPLPPLDEQRRIVAHVAAESARLDRAVAAIAAQLDRLREYRQALITEAVTGRIPLARMEAP